MAIKKYWDEEIETISKNNLKKYQLEHLKKQLEWAFNKSSYYRQSFLENNVALSKLKSLQDVHKLPFINKKIERDRQLAKPLLGDLVCVHEEKVIFISTSSGSTGVPTVSPFTTKDFKEFQDVESRLFWGVGMRPKDRYLHALNFSLFVGGPDVIGAQNLGALSIWAGSIPSDRLLFIMKEFQPTITWTTPSYAWFLGETAKKQGIDPAKDLSIRKIIVAGEPGGSIPATRKAIESLWNADLYDFFGISDIFGACAGMCENKDGLHLAEDHIFLEVINPDTLEPVAEGEEGEMVLTTLRKEARPMIRFRTGDIITATSEKCACGRTLKRIKVKGRLDDMIIISGVNIFPSDIEFIVRGIEHLTGEYRITVFEEDHLSKLTIEIEKEDHSTIEDIELASLFRDKVKTRFGIKPKEIKILPKGHLPRETHKAKRLIDLRNKN
jgi:phenylacetate-CoA ligase